MLEFYFSFLPIFFFAAGGFFLKKLFREKICERTIIFLNIYFFQSILAIWGFSTAKIDAAVFWCGAVHFSILIFALAILFFLARFFFCDPKMRAIFAFAPTNGNTGNFGIPLGIFLFGAQSIIFTTIINFVNIFWNFVFGVYFFSRGNFSVRKSIANIFKLPILYFSVFAIFLNFVNFKFPPKIFSLLEIGAHAAIALQIFLIGVFSAKINFRQIFSKINFSIIFLKIFLLPIFGFCTIFFAKNFFDFPPIFAQILLLQLAVPAAVNNFNLAKIFDCRAEIVAEIVFLSTIFFIFLSPLFLYFLF